MLRKIQQRKGVCLGDHDVMSVALASLCVRAHTLHTTDEESGAGWCEREAVLVLLLSFARSLFGSIQGAGMSRAFRGKARRSREEIQRGFCLEFDLLTRSLCVEWVWIVLDGPGTEKGAG